MNGFTCECEAVFLYPHKNAKLKVAYWRAVWCVTVQSLLELCLCAVGMAFWVWRRVIPLSGLLAAGLLAGAAVVRLVPVLAPLFEPVLALALGYGVFVIGYAKSPVLARYNRVTDGGPR